jgi:hypothetical protein
LVEPIAEPPDPPAELLPKTPVKPVGPVGVLPEPPEVLVPKPPLWALAGAAPASIETAKQADDKIVRTRRFWSMALSILFNSLPSFPQVLISSRATRTAGEAKGPDRRGGGGQLRGNINGLCCGLISEAANCVAIVMATVLQMIRWCRRCSSGRISTGFHGTAIAPA